jgi:hypothetical protein
MPNAMKTCGEMKARSTILDLCTTCRRVVNLTPWPLSPGEGATCSHCIKSSVGPRSSLDPLERRQISCLCQDSDFGSWARSQKLYRVRTEFANLSLGFFMLSVLWLCYTIAAATDSVAIDEWGILKDLEGSGNDLKEALSWNLSKRLETARLTNNTITWMTIVGVWYGNRIHWTLKHIIRECNLQVTITQRLVFTVTVFIALLDNVSQQWKFHA